VDETDQKIAALTKRLVDQKPGEAARERGDGPTEQVIKGMIDLAVRDLRERDPHGAGIIARLGSVVAAVGDREQLRRHLEHLAAALEITMDDLEYRLVPYFERDALEQRMVVAIVEMIDTLCSLREERRQGLTAHEVEALRELHRHASLWMNDHEGL
jgi:hypothetical protein